MKTVIIPDIHFRFDNLQKFVSIAEKDDKIIFLGDFCDDFNFDADTVFIHDFFLTKIVILIFIKYLFSRRKLVNPPNNIKWFCNLYNNISIIF